MKTFTLFMRIFNRWNVISQIIKSAFIRVYLRFVFPKSDVFGGFFTQVYNISAVVNSSFLTIQLSLC